MSQLLAKVFEFECRITKEDLHFVFIKPLNQTTKLVVLTIPEMTIGDLKQVIFGIAGTPTDTQRLIFAGRNLLEDGRTLRENDI